MFSVEKYGDIMKTYRMRINNTPTELVSKASSIAAEKGLRFDGDESHGDFGAMGVEGNYRISNEEIVVQITSKPFLVPWSMVEKYVRDFFE